MFRNFYSKHNAYAYTLIIIQILLKGWYQCFISKTFIHIKFHVIIFDNIGINIAYLKYLHHFNISYKIWNNIKI